MAPYLKVLDQLSRTEPNNALVQAALGNRNLQNEKFQEAADHLRRALKIGPSQATYYGELAAALQKLGRTEEALSIQKEAVQKDPYNPILQKRWCFF